MKTLIFKSNKSKRGTLRQFHLSTGRFLGIAFGLDKGVGSRSYTFLFLCFQVEIEITKK